MRTCIESMTALPRMTLLGWTLVVGLFAFALGERNAAGAVAAAVEKEELSPALRDWYRGPVRWLIEPREIRAYRKIDDGSEALEFIRDFWRRRDPTPEDDENPFADEFSRRLDLADRLYTEESERGSLTHRGGALILLGAPSAIRVFRRRSPQVRVPGRPATGAVQEVEIEQWTYSAEDLRFLGRASGEGAVLTFVRRPKETRLTKGRELLGEAARARVVH